MKIQIDSEAKNIKVEETVNFGELITFLEENLKGYKEYKLEVATVTNLIGWPVIQDLSPRPMEIYYNSPSAKHFTNPYDVICQVN